MEEILFDKKAFDVINHLGANIYLEYHELNGEEQYKKLCELIKGYQDSGLDEPTLYFDNNGFDSEGSILKIASFYDPLLDLNEEVVAYVDTNTDFAENLHRVSDLTEDNTDNEYNYSLANKLGEFTFVRIETM